MGKRGSAWRAQVALQSRLDKEKEEENILRARVPQATMGTCWHCSKQKPVLLIYCRMFWEDIPQCARCGNWDFEEQEKMKAEALARGEARKRRAECRRKKLEEQQQIQKRKDYCRKFWCFITSMYVIIQLWFSITSIYLILEMVI